MKVGDRVRYREGDWYGKIVGIRAHQYAPIAVEYEKELTRDIGDEEDLSCDGLGRDGYCLWTDRDALKVVGSANEWKGA